MESDPNSALEIRSYLTRHGEGFDISREVVIKPELCPYQYFSTCPGYTAKRRALANFVGKEHFLWAYEKERGFRHREGIKPVEWELRLGHHRVLGYVDDDKWGAIRENERWDGSAGSDLSELRECYTVCRPSKGDFSVLLRFPIWPLLADESFEKRCVPPTDNFGAAMRRRPAVT
jgi:hypothetical protein